jgi:hypothetical protein
MKTLHPNLFLLAFFLVILSNPTFTQVDWSQVDFKEAYNRKFKLSGGAVKSLKENPTFVNGYKVGQATLMTGSNTSAKSAVSSEISLGGMDNEKYQEMVNELYSDFERELKQLGLNLTDGKDVIESKEAQKQLNKAKKDDVIGPIGNQTIMDGKKKISEGAMPGYGAWAVTADASFYPENVYVYTDDSHVQVGHFMKVASNTMTNLLSVKYYVSFASFDQNRGYKDISVETKPVLAVAVNVQLTPANLSKAELTYAKMPIWGSADWSEGMTKGKDNKNTAEVLGLARSAEYQVTANPEKYIEEVRSIISSLQKDIVEGIKEQLEN